VTAGNTSTANLTLTSTRGGIVGKVTSTSGGAAVSGATVTLAGTSAGSTTTDASGNYSFSGLAAGSYTVTPSKTGYQPATASNVTVSLGVNATKDLTLTPYPILSTGYKFPTTAVAAPGGDGNGYQTFPASWFTAFDGSVATDPSSGTASSQTCGASTRDQEVFNGFSFGSLGSGSVLGIQVQLRGRANSSGSSPRFCIQLSSDGTTWTAGKVTTTLKTTLTTYTLGTTSDLWGRSWTAAQLASGTFRVRITDLASSTARTFYLDGVAVAVTYQ
jgi:hypothetical protein